MLSIRLTAAAKLNLFLHVTGKRTDGYHLLESLVAFTEFGDELTIEPAETLILDITGPFAGTLENGGENLVMKAARLLQSHTGCAQGAHISLQKNIPVGAGLGGGSSDAAAALLGLKKLWGSAISDAGLQILALKLGSDVPVCLLRQPAWMQGMGEILAPVDFHNALWVVLVNPRISLPTAEVFRRFSGSFASACPAPENFYSRNDLFTYIAPKHNMLEAAATALVPAIGDVLAAIGATECKLARMSGSGATCFGIYDNEISARQAAREIQRKHPNWWAVATRIYGQAQ